MLRSYWLEGTIIIILFILGVFPNVFCLDTDSASNAILALTAVVVIWYTHETKSMKNEIAKQNLLQTRPILTLELRNRNVFVRNQGKGPALNSRVKSFSVFPVLGDGEGYTFYLPSFLALDSEEKFVMIRNSPNSIGTLSEPDVFFDIAKTINISLQYEDVEGIVYETSTNIRRANTEKISIIKRARVA